MKRPSLILAFALLAVLCLGLLPGYGQESQQRRGDADEQPGASVPVLLVRLPDLNEDGKLTRIEYTRFFSQADQDEDGLVTQDEIAEAMTGPDPARKLRILP